jgi:outer membrane protein OmpA-like peptidoglycan-associated protein
MGVASARMSSPREPRRDELRAPDSEPASLPAPDTQPVTGSPGAQHVLALQRGAGNAAVARALAAGRQPQPSIARLPSRGRLLQRDIALSAPTNQGIFEINMIAKDGALTGKGATGLDGTISFRPDEKSPYTSKLGLIQLVKLQDAKGTDINSASMPAASMPFLRTTEDKKAGVEAGFVTDVLHEDFGQTPSVVAPKGKAHTPYYEGGTPIFGFRRSEKAADIKAAQLDDFPGTTDKTAEFDFGFETVAKGDDNQVVYGALKWAFKIRAGKVQDETSSVSDAGSATFDAALAAHRDFYVHEPVTIYCDFDGDEPSAGEEPKFDEILPYLAKFPDARIKAEGFADLRGSATHNLGLARRRAQKSIDALVARGIDASRFDAPVGTGITTSFAADAVTAQGDEANRRANRRVMLTFERTASTP